MAMGVKRNLLRLIILENIGYLSITDDHVGHKINKEFQELGFLRLDGNKDTGCGWNGVDCVFCN